MPGKKRVAFFLPDLGGGGAERVQLAIIRHLVAAGHEVDLILAFEGGVLLPLLPAEVHVFALRARRLVSSFFGLRRYLRSRKPYSLHAVMWPCTVIAVTARLAARTSTRLVLSDHTFLSQHYPAPAARRLLRVTLPAFYPRADHRIAVSKGAAADVARLARLRADAVEVIYNPIELPEQVQSSALAEGAWQGASPRIITVGSLKAEKNHRLLLHAFARLTEQYRGARLLIVGEGPLRPALERLRDDLGLHDKVGLPGFHLNPWPFYADADLFVLSSDYEGMSLVLVEAMHAGLRVVSTDCEAGPAELLKGGEFGRLVPVGDAAALADAMHDALRDPANPDRQRARAGAISGSSALHRYADLLTG